MATNQLIPRCVENTQKLQNLLPQIKNNLTNKKNDFKKECATTKTFNAEAELPVRFSFQLFFGRAYGTRPSVDP